MPFGKDAISTLLRSRLGLNIALRVRNALSWRLDRFQNSLAARIAPDQRVVSGPFAGMYYPIPKIASSMVLPKLLGSYEEELHGAFKVIFQSHYSDIIDIGCGEGYYAVGLASRIPHARMHAFDLDARALELTLRLAELNGVLSRVIVARGCSRNQLKTLSVDSRILILSDCEGDEYRLIDPVWLPVARSIDLLVECHDSAAHPAVAEELERRFATTHEGEIISTRPRDSSDYPLLAGWSSGEIEMALSESRPPGMKWLSLRQKIAKK